MLYLLISHIAKRLEKNILAFLIALFLFLGLYSFFFGLFSIPFFSGTDIGFTRMAPVTFFEYFYIVFSSIISALIAMMTFSSARTKKADKKNAVSEKNGKRGKIASIVGIGAGAFSAICPVCLGINFGVLGTAYTVSLPSLVPYIFWAQLGGIAFLLLGLYLIAKNSYEKKCLSCEEKTPKETAEYDETNASYQKFFAGILLVAAVILLFFQISASFGNNGSFSGKKNNNKTMNIGNKDTMLQKTIEEVTPTAGFTTTVKWNGVVSKMVEQGALDPAKLENLLKERYKQDMKPEWRAILAGKNANLKINSDNAVFMMYVLWTLAKTNDNQILTDSPFAKNFKNYNIGVGKAGYGNMNILTLTPEQQKIAKKVAENANRPCCNNSTARPDCSHGFSALGLVELMASQNFSEKEIFETFVKFNSFWFPETYIKTAIYFKTAKGKEWKDVDKELVAGPEYSSVSGKRKVKAYIKNNFGF